MRLSIQNWIVAKFDELTQIRMISEAGFKYCDWDLCRFQGLSKAGKESLEETENYYKTLRAEADKLGLNIWMTHTIYPTYMDDSNRENISKRIEKCFIASSILGAKYTIVHPMMPRKWEGEENRELRVKENIKFYDDLLSLAKKYNVHVCIENMFGNFIKPGKYKETSCSRYEEMLDIFNGLKDKEYFGFCYDSGHANLNYKKDQVNMIYALGKDITTVHLHDNNAKFDFHRLPGHGNLEWDKVFEALKKVGFDGVYNFEINSTCLTGLNKQKKLNKIHSDLEKLLSLHE